MKDGRIKFSREDLERFIIEQSPEEKAAAEARAAALVEQHKQRQMEISEKITRLEQVMREKTIDFQQALATMVELQDEIAKRDIHTIVGVDEFYERQALLESIGFKQKDLEKLQDEFGQMMMLLHEMEQSIKDKTLLEQADAHLDEFYADQVENLEAHKEDQRVRDVSRICGEYNCVFVHTIDTSPQKGHAHNTMLRGGVDWKTKLNINFGLDPELSTSTLRDKIPTDGMWVGDLGLLFKGGRVVDAATVDAGTQVSGMKRISAGSKRTGKIELDIQGAVTNDRGGRYNEVVLAKPELAGLLIKDVRDVTQDIFKMAKKKGIPVYTRDEKTGAFHVCVGFKRVIRSNREIEVLDVGEEVPVQDILDNDYHLSDSDKREARDSVFEDSPFKLDSKERREVNKVLFARGLYGDFDVSIKDENGNINETNIAKHYADTNYVCVGANLLETSIQIKDRATYLDAVKAGFDQYVANSQKEIDEFKRMLSVGREINGHGVSYQHLVDSRVSSIESLRSELGFLLHEFATVAEQKNDLDVAKKAREIGGVFIDLDHHREVVDRRVGPNGEFRITEKDLKDIGTYGS